MRAVSAIVLFAAGVLPVVVGVAPAFAASVHEGKTPAPARGAAPLPGGQLDQDQLFARLAKAESPEEAKPIEDKLEILFRASGSPSIDLLMNRADVASAHGDTAMARKLVDAVTRIDPRYAEGWHARAVLQSQAGDDAGAMVSLQRAVALNPRQFNALRALAGMLDDYGDKTGALKLYRQAQALDPQLEGVERRIRALTREIEGQNI